MGHRLAMLRHHDALLRVIGIYLLELVQERALEVRLVKLRDRHVLMHGLECCRVMQGLHVFVSN